MILQHPNIKNPEIYTAYLNLLKKVLADNEHHFSKIWKLKQSRDSLDYNPYLKSFAADLPDEDSILDGYIRDIWIKNDILLQRIIEYTVDGLYQAAKVLEEYKTCVSLMTSHEVIGKQINKSLSVLYSHQLIRDWTYVSHFLKRMIFLYFQKHEIDYDGFSKYFSAIESFFYQEILDFADVTPLHHFQVVGFSHERKLVKLRCSIILSDRLHIIPLTYEDRLRLKDEFPVSRLDNSNDRINYLIEYKYKVRKGFDERGEIEGEVVNTHHYFSTVVTLFRLIGIHCGIHDVTSVSELDLPIHFIGVNLFVSSLGVAYDTNPYVDLNTLGNFRNLWILYGDLLVKKILNYQRFDSDPFANLKISIGRFNDAFERKDGTDAFIDNVVAIEALFSKKDDKFTHDKTEMLSKRLAVFIEKDSHKREELFCRMIELYKERNEIIHGGYTEHYDIVKTREYLIRSYLEYFKFLSDADFSHVDFIKSLDVEGKQITKTYNECIAEIEAKSK